MNRRARWQTVLGYLIGLAILVTLIYLGGVKSIQATFSPNPGFLLLTFIAHLALSTISAIRWGYMINVMEKYKVCSYYSYFFAFISGNFFGQYISRAGGDLLLRPSILNRISGVSLKNGFYAVFLEKVLDIIFIFIVLIPAILYLFNLTTGFISLLILSVSLIFLLYLFVWKNIGLLAVLKKLLERIFFILKKMFLLNRLAKDRYLEKIRHLDKLALFEREALLNLFTMTLVRYLTVVCRLYFLAIALDLSIPLPVLFVGLPIAQLSLALSFTPGGLGVLEGGWYAVFAIAGIPQVDRVTFLIGQRVYFLIFPSIIFLISYLVFGAKRWLQFEGAGVFGQKDR